MDSEKESVILFTSKKTHQHKTTEGLINMKLTNLLILIITLRLIVEADVVTDENFGYSVFLPPNWVKEKIGETKHRFEDTSGVYKSMIVIAKYDFGAETVFKAPEEWTRANFIAYSFYTDADPFSVLVYYDTVTARQNGTLWAADAFSQFISINDTTLIYGAEYIRFTASGTTGYEIYAIGPADDMNANVGYYAAIIEGITINQHLAISRISYYKNIGMEINRSAFSLPTINLLGRTVKIGRGTMPVSNLLLFVNDKNHRVILRNSGSLK